MYSVVLGLVFHCYTKLDKLAALRNIHTYRLILELKQVFLLR